MTGKSMAKTVMIGTHVDQELLDKLEAAANALGLSKAALVRLLLRKGLSQPVVLSTEIVPPPSD
jgi:antitoxin component of RelBE/YafQ-DinJ toxin-antitoxin module